MGSRTTVRFTCVPRNTPTDHYAQRQHKPAQAALEDSALVGCVDLFLMEIRLDLHDNRRGLFKHILTDPEWDCRGVFYGR